MPPAHPPEFRRRAVALAREVDEDGNRKYPLRQLLDRFHWKTRAQLAQAIFEWIEVFYNQQRRHSTLGMLSPVRYADAGLASPAA
jgi:transposase InsO family protein